ncbi:hypothetical protein PUR71_09065 [Streptomyces sp. SP17BM10]|uniref:hypothetical protein n=1 Tax=Streptomyces sp. SP17BM10 TaxID=3002530 RepID=UPI002E78E978|nr:hypothetical protein [Streptomyces sp. SP17BM10]MEE1783065.1 hypothetical protein [Streptomyces sp. SP17BM10]
MTATDRAARFATAYALLRAAGAIGDMWVQTDTCARIKGATDTNPVIDRDEQAGTETVHGTREGQLACLHHCATYTATQAGALLIGSRLLGLRLNPGRVAAALALSFATHYVADRRRPLARLAEATGKKAFYERLSPICGSFELDQAFHHGCETAAALLLAR